MSIATSSAVAVDDRCAERVQGHALRRLGLQSGHNIEARHELLYRCDWDCDDRRRHRGRGRGRALSCRGGGGRCGRGRRLSCRGGGRGRGLSRRSGGRGRRRNGRRGCGGYGFGRSGRWRIPTNRRCRGGHGCPGWCGRVSGRCDGRPESGVQQCAQIEWRAQTRKLSTSQCRVHRRTIRFPWSRSGGSDRRKRCQGHRRRIRCSNVRLNRPT